jgi:hypothetical protein
VNNIFRWFLNSDRSDSADFRRFLEKSASFYKKRGNSKKGGGFPTLFQFPWRLAPRLENFLLDRCQDRNRGSGDAVAGIIGV